MVAAGLAFLHLAVWSMGYLTTENLTGALALYLIFGALHAVVPVVPARRLPDSAAVLPLRAGSWFAPLVLLMMLVPVFHLSPVPLAIWAAVPLAGLLVIVQAEEAVWHTNHFQAEAPPVALSWYLGFYALFLVFPFVFRKACAGQAAPWIASALSGAGHFLLVHDLVKRAWPNGMMGLVPLAC